MIDLHVHLRDWSQSNKETVEHGLSVARRCGITRVADMPNTDPPITDRETALERLALAGEAVKKHHVSYSLYMGLTANEEQIVNAVNAHNELFPLVIGLKMFAGHSTGNMGIISEEDQKKVFRVLANAHYKGILAIHCEKESELHLDLYEKGRTETWSLARPTKAEAESVKDMIAFSKEAGFEGKLHVCHISSKEALEIVKEVKRAGVDISCGATPHHALLNTESAKHQELMLKMNPPLRSEEDRRAIYEGLISGDIDFVESDHAPHTREDKEKGASGIPDLYGNLYLLRQLKKDGVPKSRLEEIFALSAARRYGLDCDGRLLPDRLDWRISQVEDEYFSNPYKALGF